jgi:uncharacterized protein YdeI (YjbR/CyaY-like superfamily)
MAAKSLKTLDVRSRAQWRAWLEKHHRSESEIWLVFYKLHTGRKSPPYEDTVEEALCFGWVDSLVRRLDDDRFARKFTPRNADSRWSPSNIRRYADLKRRGRLASAGAARPPTDRIAVAPPRWAKPRTPVYIEKAFKAVPAAWKNFEQLAPSYRRAFVGWIDVAKRADTKQRRLKEAIAKLEAGEKLGLK